MLRSLSLLAVALLAGSMHAQTPHSAAEELEAFLGRFPDLGPGYAVVVVTPDEVLLRHVAGVRRAESELPLTADTPMYIASQTKAYVGLLAARLDVEGVLSLDARIVDYWPEVKFPGGVDPKRWSLRDLLGHNVPIECGYITGMEAYVTELDSADYPALIEQHASARPEGHRYANLGYNIWAAILETATEKTWRTWLDEKLFDPLELTRTSSRSSDFALDELSWNHIWQGPELGWFEVPPKTDPLMQSAGGLVTSVDDMARFLQVQLQGPILEGTGITSEMVSLAQAPASIVDPSERNPYELPVDAYTLGWNRADFEGHTLFLHGGGYTGARSMMAFSPEMGAGIGVFSNSDNMTGWLTSRTVVQFFQYLVDADDADRMADVRAEVYPERIRRLLADREQERETRRADASWEGWSWDPEESELREFCGAYVSDDPYLNAEVSMEAGALHVRVGGLNGWMEPARKDLFGGFTGPFDGPEPVPFERDAKGQVLGFEWDDTRYRRAPND